MSDDAPRFASPRPTLTTDWPPWDELRPTQTLGVELAAPRSVTVRMTLTSEFGRAVLDAIDADDRRREVVAAARPVVGWLIARGRRPAAR